MGKSVKRPKKRPRTPRQRISWLLEQDVPIKDIMRHAKVTEAQINDTLDWRARGKPNRMRSRFTPDKVPDREVPLPPPEVHQSGELPWLIRLRYTTVHELIRAARRRGLTMDQVIERILRTIATEKMIDAVLDDEAEAEGGAVDAVNNGGNG